MVAGAGAAREPDTCTPESAVINGDDDLGEESLPPDTLVAIRLMRAEFPKAEAVATRPFALRSQLYSSIPDRTLVDRQLEELKARNAVRLFKLATTKDDYAVMLVEDYAAQIEVERRRMEGGPVAPHVAAALAAFVDYVLPGTSAAGVSQAELVRLLSCKGLKVRDHHVSALIHAGFLVRQLADQTAYWFSIPNVGRIVKAIVQGRKELMRLVSRQKFGEMLRSQLAAKRLRFSPLGMKFHLRDLLGSGHLVEVPTTAGPLIRVPPK